VLGLDAAVRSVACVNALSPSGKLAGIVTSPKVISGLGASLCGSRSRIRSTSAEVKADIGPGKAGS